MLPLSKKLSEEAVKVYEKLASEFMCEYDESGSIGKRYRRQDEIGTPFCITYDFDSRDDDSVTVRHRDSMEQERVKIEEFDGLYQRENCILINHRLGAYKCLFKKVCRMSF